MRVLAIAKAQQQQEPRAAAPCQGQPEHHHRTTGRKLRQLAREEAMAAHRQALLLAVVVAAACLASLASATDWMVGDNDGWRAKFNTTGWANDKTFRVGDTLTFMYPSDKHTVVQVGNKDDFVSCNLNANSWTKSWNSGNDVVTLDKPGKMWFFCSVTGHCANGMKLVITVEDAAPTPAPPGPSSSATVTGYTVGGAVAAGAVVASVLVF